MTERDLSEAIYHGIIPDTEWISTASPEQLAPFMDALEQARDNLTWAYEKARKQQVSA